MQVTKTKAELMKQLAPVRLDDRIISFVPTMGALHKGHISLVERARSESDMVICSIFVNPTQFNNPDDLKKYPRTEDKDIAMLEEAKADIVFIPSVEEMYPPGEKEIQEIDFGILDKVMEGAQRPSHFKGVATIVSRLFEIVRPHKAYFGEKDFQQLALIRELVCQQQMPIEIIGCATVREENGLAMSSRNMCLTEAERTEAAVISKALAMVRQEWRKSSIPDIKKRAIQLIEQTGSMKVDYLEVADERTLAPATSLNGENLRCFVAVQVGAVRLIDNLPLN